MASERAATHPAADARHDCAISLSENENGAARDERQEKEGLSGKNREDESFSFSLFDECWACVASTSTSTFFNSPTVSSRLSANDAFLLSLL